MFAFQSPVSGKDRHRAENCDEVFSINTTRIYKVQGVIKCPVQAAAVMHEHAR